MNDKQRFSRYTKLLREKFPTWSRIRKDPNAIGSQFLSVFGVRLDDVEWMLTYAYEQLYIGTADINQLDIIYKARIPNSLIPTIDFRLSSDGHILHGVDNIQTFIQSSSHLSALQYDTSYYIDYETKYVYVKHPFGKNDAYPDGQLTLAIPTVIGDMTFETLPLMMHMVWNFFDEFGLLLNTPRLHGEKNADYKERILDVFRRPSSSTYDGLINGIARELGLVYNIVWDDAGRDLILYQPRIDTTTIQVNNTPVIEEDISIDDSGRVVIKGHGEDSGIQKQVRYIAGVHLHELNDRTDEAFMGELYSVDGHATPLLKYYVETIRNHVPILWGQWKWDQGMWDVADENMNGFGFIPTYYDASIAGWKRQALKEGNE